jgi:hypothetical protein
LISIIISIQDGLLAWTAEEGSCQLVFEAVGGRDDEEKIKGAFIHRSRAEEVDDFVLSDDGRRMQDTIWVGVVIHSLLTVADISH